MYKSKSGQRVSRYSERWERENSKFISSENSTNEDSYKLFLIRKVACDCLRAAITESLLTICVYVFEVETLQYIQEVLIRCLYFLFHHTLR